MAEHNFECAVKIIKAEVFQEDILDQLATEVEVLGKAIAIQILEF